MTYKKKAGVKISEHFNSGEFDCPCDNCSTTLIDHELIIRLEKLRVALGTSLHVNSGYRCTDYQMVLKQKGYDAALVSQHTQGKAADIQTGVHTGKELEEAARKVGFTSVGVGKHFVHLDIREGNHSWKYTY